MTQASVPKGQQRLLFLLQPNASAGAGGPAFVLVKEQFGVRPRLPPSCLRNPKARKGGTPPTPVELSYGR